jgi:hypothetical protein
MDYMPAAKPKTITEKRIGFTVPPEVVDDLDMAKAALGATSDAALAAMITAFAVQKVKRGELANVNGALVPSKNGVPIIQTKAD